MSIQELVRGIVGQMMAAPLFAGTYVAGTYRVMTPGTYDPLTSTLSPPTVVEFLVQVQDYGYRADELIPDVVLPTDRKILLQQAQHPEKPSIQDEVLLGNTLYSIVGVTEEAPGITWTIQGRRKGRAA